MIRTPLIAKHLWILLWVALAVTLPPPEVSAEDLQIDIRGVSGDLRQNVEAALATSAGVIRDGRVVERWLDRFIKRIPTLVQEALEPYGHYHSTATVERVEGEDGIPRLSVAVDPGPAVTIRTLQLRIVGTGRDEDELKKARKTFPLVEGGPLRHDLYESGKNDLRLEAIDLGYLDASYPIHALVVFPDENAAEIELELDTGPRFEFGDTRIEHSGRYEESFLRRFLTYKKGETFSHTELHRSRINFYRNNRFEEVLIVPRIEAAEGVRVPIDIRLSPAKRRRLRPGIGYGTNTGARFSLRYNSLGDLYKTHAYQADINISEKKQVYDNMYTIPLDRSADDNLIANFGYQHENINTYENEIFYVEGERSFGLGRNRVGSFFTRFTREVYDDDANQGNSSLLIPGVRYRQRDFDDLLNPTRGYQFRIEVRGAAEATFSDLTLVQGIAAGSLMLPLTTDLTLHTRGEGAFTLKDNPLEDVPPSMRFYVGGDNSVRGFAYKSQGPKDANGVVVGGDSLLIGSLELEYKATPDWGLAIFYDTGSAFNANDQNLHFIAGAGAGIRRYTPVGTIRLDLATQVSEGDSGYRFHFSVGFEL